MKCRSVAYVLTAVVCGAGLVACGNDDGGGEDDKTVAGAEPTPARPDTSPSASESARASRPEIELPADVKFSFDWRTGDKLEDEVLADSEQRIAAVEMAIAEQDPVHAAYRFYSEGAAAADSQKYIQSFVDHKARTTGLTRVYDAKVEVDEGPGKARLVYCEDQSKAYNKFLETGKADVSEPGPDSYVLYSSSLTRDAKGVWVTERLLSTRGAAQCRP
ncbi:hypothetical protein [Streptomyces sp. NPDC088923]|uniref:hypothetical protein n=1 Tax=Streptomyces sp. NPDC088923 TaxID=3365913 RepID=UPI003805CDB4